MGIGKCNSEISYNNQNHFVYKYLFYESTCKYIYLKNIPKGSFCTLFQPFEITKDSAALQFVLQPFKVDCHILTNIT